MQPLRGVWANEVEKGKIPAEHLTKSAKQLPWGAAIWDNEEAIHALKKEKGVIWIDTRPSSFFSKGTVRGARLMPYNKTGGQGNELTRAGLESTIKEAGLTKETAKDRILLPGSEMSPQLQCRVYRHRRVGILARKTSSGFVTGIPICSKRSNPAASSNARPNDTSVTKH